MLLRRLEAEDAAPGGVAERESKKRGRRGQLRGAHHKLLPTAAAATIAAPVTIADMGTEEVEEMEEEGMSDNEDEDGGDEDAGDCVVVNDDSDADDLAGAHSCAAQTAEASPSQASLSQEAASLGPVVRTVQVGKPESELGALVPSEWDDAIESLAAAMASAGARRADGAGVIVVLCGARNAGKSSFGRLLINRALAGGLATVGLLDLDPGQSEMGPPGLVSLHSVRSARLQWRVLRRR